MNGWEPREFTEYRYDGDRLVSTVTYREPEWRPEDVALALAGERLEADMGPHGIPMSVATDPANQGRFRVNKFPKKDFAAAAIGDAQDFYYSNKGKDRPRHGHLWSVRLAPAKQEPDRSDG